MNKSVTLPRNITCSNLFRMKTFQKHKTMLIMLKRHNRFYQIIIRSLHVCIMKAHMKNTKSLCYMGTHRLL